MLLLAAALVLVGAAVQRVTGLGFSLVCAPALVALLGAHRPDLLVRPRLVIGSKVDDFRADPTWEGPVISSITGEGLDWLVGQLAELVSRARVVEARAAEGGGHVVHRLVPEGFTIDREDDGTWVVHGKQVERAVALNDLTNQDALLYLHQRLERLGVDKALHKAGARQGDPVRIGRLELDYEET